MPFPSYTYLAGVLFFAGLWVLLFAIRKDLRREMLIMSALIAPLGPLSEFFYLRDYWKPQLLGGVSIGIEDLLFSFLIGGLAGVLYEVVSRKTHRRTYPRRLSWMGYALCLGVILMIVSNIFLSINSIYASSAIFLIFGILVVIVRHDLARDAFMSGLLLGLILLVFYALFSRLFPGIIQSWWQLRNISGILVFGAPLEEILWGFSWGFVAGPAYEFLAGITERPQR